ncbi:MAG: hypothetical protein ACMXYG_03560 [Candidatus Woesearchaeota archaeon]
MQTKLLVRPDKNEFLLYSMLNTLGLARGNIDSHILRRKVVDHFQGYSGLGLKQEDYQHHSKPAIYLLTLNEAPDFSERENLVLNQFIERDIEIGKSILPYLIHFYENSDFEDFYQTILLKYQEECEFLENILERSNIKNIIDDAWEENTFDMEIIPMPLEDIMSGNGPSIGNVSYQIIGPPFMYRSIEIIAHEASHPRAKEVLRPIEHEIQTKEYIFNRQTPLNYPKEYINWRVCFEEHFIRAMQCGFIDPKLGLNVNIDKSLRNEIDNYGMIFIGDFYEEIKKHKENPKGTLTDVALNILDRLDRYKID